MSLSSIARAATDSQLISRVHAAAYQALMADPEKAKTTLGKALANPSPGFNDPVTPLMWPVAIDTEAAYEYALLGGNGSPGYDVAVITDAAITDSVNANWPMDAAPEVPPPLIPETREPEPGEQVGVPENMPDHVADA